MVCQDIGQVNHLLHHCQNLSALDYIRLHLLLIQGLSQGISRLDRLLHLRLYRLLSAHWNIRPCLLLYQMECWSICPPHLGRHLSRRRFDIRNIQLH